MNCCNNIRNEKAMIMKNIYELGFALVETMLYLDTHPDDAAAIEYYAEIKDKYVQFMKKIFRLLWTSQHGIYGK